MQRSPEEKIETSEAQLFGEQAKKGTAAIGQEKLLAESEQTIERPHMQFGD